VRGAAEALNVSEKTIRRRIKSGKIKAELVDGEYYIRHLGDVQPVDEVHVARVDSGLDNTLDMDRGMDKSWDKALDMISSLQAENGRLAGQVGFLQAKVLEMENKVLMLRGPTRRLWWQRLVWWKRRL